MRDWGQEEKGTTEDDLKKYIEHLFVRHMPGARDVMTKQVFCS